MIFQIEVTSSILSSYAGECLHYAVQEAITEGLLNKGYPRPFADSIGITHSGSASHMVRELCGRTRMARFTISLPPEVEIGQGCDPTATSPFAVTVYLPTAEEAEELIFPGTIACSDTFQVTGNNIAALRTSPPTALIVYVVSVAKPRWREVNVSRSGTVSWVTATGRVLSSPLPEEVKIMLRDRAADGSWPPLEPFEFTLQYRVRRNETQAGRPVPAPLP